MSARRPLSNNVLIEVEADTYIERAIKLLDDLQGMDSLDQHTAEQRILQAIGELDAALVKLGDAPR